RVHIRQRPVTGVAVTPASASMHIGLTVQLTATPQDAAGKALSGRVVTWTSSDAGVATVSSSGLVTGLTAGLATITATSEGKRGTSAITITQIPVAAVSVSPATASLATGQTVQLAATPQDAGGKPLRGRVVTWTSGNGAVATVSGSGLVSALAAGSAAITASSEGQSGGAAVTVTAVSVPVASVGVSPTTANLTTGQTVQLAATPQDASGNPLTGRAVTWTSNNGSVGNVNGSGLVTALAAGSATITATSEGKSGTASVAVTTPPTGSGECASPQPAW